MLGCSPRRTRSTNSSPSLPTNSSRSSESNMAMSVVGRAVPPCSVKSVEETRCLFQERLQSFDRSHVPCRRPRLRKPQHARGLCIGELLEMPQGQNFTIDGIQGIEGLLQFDAPLRLEG